MSTRGQGLGPFTVQGVVLSRTGAPAVHYRVALEDGSEVSFEQDIEEAREHAHLVLEAAANAEYEASLMAWATNPKQGPGLERDQAAALLADLRDYRVSKWGQKPIEDWRPRPEGAHRMGKLGNIPDEER